jgi:DnaJ-class molecular chaperone
MSLLWTGAQPASTPKPSGLWTRCTYCGGRGKITVTWNGDEDECDACEGAGGFGPVKKESNGS